MCWKRICLPLRAEGVQYQGKVRQRLAGFRCAEVRMNCRPSWAAGVESAPVPDRRRSYGDCVLRLMKLEGHHLQTGP